MTKAHLFPAALLVAIALPAAAATLPPETALVEDGSLTVDAADFEGYMLRVPENKRGDVRINYDRVANIVDSLYLTRSIAAKARAAGLDRDPIVQRRLMQVQEALLADLYVQKMEKDAAPIDLEPRAREIYKAEQTNLVTPEHVYIQQILVTLNGRTREMALERATKAAEEAKSGKDFLAVAATYSDDTDKRHQTGDLGYMNKTSFVAPLVKTIEGMTKKGEIAGPIESERGFYVIKFIDRKPEQRASFESVRRKLIESEKEKLQKKRIEDLFADIRSSSTTKVHPENVQKLVVPVDISKLQSAGESPPKR